MNIDSNTKRVITALIRRCNLSVTYISCDGQYFRVNLRNNDNNIDVACVGFQGQLDYVEVIMMDHDEVVQDTERYLFCDREHREEVNIEDVIKRLQEYASEHEVSL